VNPAKDGKAEIEGIGENAEVLF